MSIAFWHYDGRSLPEIPMSIRVEALKIGWGVSDAMDEHWCLTLEESEV
jgi:hypothetical protein